MFFSKYVLIALLMAVMIFDLLLTVFCQPDSYWQDHTSCVENNPIGRALLSRHPNWFIVLFGFWLLLIVVLVAKLKGLVGLGVAVTALAGHTWGSSSWIHHVYASHIEIDDWCVALGYYTVIGLAAAMCAIRIYEEESAAKFFAED